VRPATTRTVGFGNRAHDTDVDFGRELLQRTDFDCTDVDIATYATSVQLSPFTR
jgi:hypothetical protein